MVAPQQVLMLRSLCKAIKPQLIIGKHGLSAGIEREFLLMLKKHGLIKIKLLRAALSHAQKHEYITRLSAASGAIPVYTLGLTISFYSPGFSLAKIRQNLYKHKHSGERPC